MRGFELFQNAALKCSIRNPCVIRSIQSSQMELSLNGMASSGYGWIHIGHFVLADTLTDWGDDPFRNPFGDEGKIRFR